MITIIQFTLRSDRISDRDAIPSPLEPQPLWVCPDEIETWEFDSTPKNKSEPQLIPRIYGTQHL